ncbi:MAG TPA: 4a-hydroxytetrahydrobiopterin dehydratase [Melioribacteraceae bacterium]|nr:4a-hydroxytetrahydrobiopterin dehydratase [Melioribacteraceae bacterium]
MISKEIDEIISKYNWRREDKTLRKTFKLKDFSSATAFIIQIALISESIDHHPDILLHNYNNVTIITTTHSVNNISPKDIELIDKIEKL